MFRNYLKIAWRNLLKNKGYSLINIGGLALGMAVTLIIGLWMYDELSHNSYFQNKDKIAQVLVPQFRCPWSQRCAMDIGIILSTL